MEPSIYHVPENPMQHLDLARNVNRGTVENLTVPHKVINWPAISQQLHARGAGFTQDLDSISFQGSQWFVERSKWTATTLTSTTLQCPDSNSEFTDSTKAPSSRIFHHYGEIAIKGYVEAYFRIFNKMRPILDHAVLQREVELQFMHTDHPSREVEAVLLLLVISLGQVVYEGTAGAPIEPFARRSSGIRGGTAFLPPGGACFHEALRRWALIPHPTSVLGVQVLLLQCSFYESTARHWDFWQCAVAASATCMHLVKGHEFGWDTPDSETLKRVYWACVLDEGYYHHDLDLPETGIFAVQDDVPLPSFVRNIDEPVVASVEAIDSPTAYLHFLANISLKRIVDRIHDVVHESMSSIPDLIVSTYTPLGIHLDASSDTIARDPPRRVLSELIYQLQQWRVMLPPGLNWSDDLRNQPSDSLNAKERSEFKDDLGVVVAQLRARFYNARFTLLSPFLYLALHCPERLSVEDRSHCVLALDSTLLWPLSVASVSDRKRLIPHHFTWTQNAMNFLCIFLMIGRCGTLKRICEQHLDLRELRISVAVQLSWLRDVKAIDKIADWAWHLMSPLFIRGKGELSARQIVDS